MAAQAIRWETSNPSVSIAEPASKVAALAPGASGEAPLTFTVYDESREIVRVFAVAGGQRMPLDIHVFPPTLLSTDFRIADGKSYRIYQNAIELQDRPLGTGNGDGRASPGETIAILLPDGDGFRAAELLTADRCLDSSARESDSWSVYDHVGASAKYSLPSIRADCPPGRSARVLVRVQLPNKPNHRLRYAAIDLPILR